MPNYHSSYPCSNGKTMMHTIALVVAIYAQDIFHTVFSTYSYIQDCCSLPLFFNSSHVTVLNSYNVVTLHPFFHSDCLKLSLKQLWWADLSQLCQFISLSVNHQFILFKATVAIYFVTFTMQTIHILALQASKIFAKNKKKQYIKFIQSFDFSCAVFEWPFLSHYVR